MSAHIDMRLAKITSEMDAILEKDSPYLKEAFCVDISNGISYQGHGYLDRSSVLCEDCGSLIESHFEGTEDEDVEIKTHYRTNMTSECHICLDLVTFDMNHAWIYHTVEDTPTDRHVTSGHIKNMQTALTLCRQYPSVYLQAPLTLEQVLTCCEGYIACYHTSYPSS